MVTFEKYFKEMYPQALEQVRKLLNETQLGAVEELALRLSHLLESERLRLPDTKEAHVFRLLAIKACNELRGFVGCCWAGTTWATHHHARALIEIYANTVHLVIDPAERENRFAKFLEFQDLLRLQRHLRDVAKYNSEEYELRRRMVSRAEVEALQQHEARWKTLYGKKIINVREWHSPAPIKQMLEECDRYELEPDEDSGGEAESARNAVDPDDGNDDEGFRWAETYGQVCHMTHVSPVGHHGVVAGGFPLFGFTRDLQQLRNEIVVAGEALVHSIVVWDAQFIPGEELRALIAPQVNKYREHTFDASKYGARHI